MEVVNQQIKEDLLNTYRGQAKTEIMFLSNKIYCDEIEGKLKSTYKCDELKKHEYILVDPNSFKIIIKRRDNSIKNWYLKYWRNSRVKIEKESETPQEVVDSTESVESLDKKIQDVIKDTELADIHKEILDFACRDFANIIELYQVAIHDFGRKTGTPIARALSLILF